MAWSVLLNGCPRKRKPGETKGGWWLIAIALPREEMFKRTISWFNRFIRNAGFAEFDPLLSCRENSWRNRLNPPTRWQEEVRQDKDSSEEQMVVLIAIARNIPFSRSHTTSKSRWCIEKQNSKLNREPLDARSSTIHVENSEATAVEIHLSSST